MEEYNRPVFLFSEIGEEAKGSARSIPEINVHLLLSSMQDMLETFGGHKIAAGLTLKKENLSLFRSKVSEYILTNINDEVFTPVQYYDIEVKLSDLNKELLAGLAKLEPFGLANANPKFKICVDKIDVIPMKNCPNHCTMKLGSGVTFVEFNYACDHNPLKFCKNKCLIFELQENSYSKELKGIIRANNYDFPVVFNKNFNAEILETLSYCGEKSPRA